MSAARPANRLAQETSPYLLQHAHNPVDWYPWGDEAFERARAEDKPVLLSVGYSACHWCHVMERESFEDEGIATLMNEHFVPVKVDREERPDVDSVYMAAVQAMSGAGGWPMTVFLTPDGQPFYGGTYYPPDDRYGRPGFRRVLTAVHEAWTERRDQVLQGAGELSSHIAAQDRLPGAAGNLEPTVADAAFEVLWRDYDQLNGGFGSAPKFPNPGALEFLLQYHARTGHERALAIVEGSLAGMARGGIYDHLGGGFARYSTDEHWLVPHFEKMLYDNAQLARLYLHAFQVTGRAEHERVCRETLDYLLRDMTAPEGGFYSAEDADSEGEEGKYYVFSAAEVREVLGGDYPLFAAAYGVSEAGNWEGKNILTLAALPEEVGAGHGLTVDDVRARLAAGRARLLEYRGRRVRPGRDDKVIASWNGLALMAFAEAGRVLGEERYLDAARRNADFLRRSLMPEGRLLHTYKNGRARVHGMLDDLALCALGFLELYAATFERALLDAALSLAGEITRRYSADIGFYDTPDDAERLLVRPRSTFDAAMPSGNGAAATLLLRLARLTGISQWEETAAGIVGGARPYLLQQPTGFGSLLQALEGLLRPPREVAIVGELDSPGGRALRRELDRAFLPHVAVAGLRSGEDPYLPVLEGRSPLPGALASAFVCEAMACRLPVSDPARLREQIHG
ncbi:MAG TPA: thioredoxin domain-containing protein [Deinococcales bacterium]|nr:thioredoxin domain-containing protein [Deinococcales bacterium]